MEGSELSVQRGSRIVIRAVKDEAQGSRLPARAKNWGFRRVVVGGGTVSSYPDLFRRDVSLNISDSARPHVVADVADMPLADGSVESVFFECLPYPAFTDNQFGGLKEAARVLKPGGKLHIITGCRAPLSEITTELRRLGIHGRIVDAGGHDVSSLTF